MSNAADFIVVQCGHCNKRFKGSAKLAGRTVKCSACGGAITVPGAAAAAVAPAAASAPRRPVAAQAAVSVHPQPQYAPEFPAQEEPDDFESALAAAASEASTAPPSNFPPAYAPQAYAQPGQAVYTPAPAPYSPPRVRRPMNPRLVKGLIVGGLVVVVGVLAYFLVFNSTRYKLAGTWVPKKGTLFAALALEWKFTYTGSFTMNVKDHGETKSVTGTWEFASDNAIKIKIDPKSLGKTDGGPTNASDLEQTISIDFPNADTLKITPKAGPLSIEFERK